MASFRVPLGVLRHNDLKSLEKLSVGLRWKYASGDFADAPEPLTDYLDVSVLTSCWLCEDVCLKHVLQLCCYNSIRYENNPLMWWLCGPLMCGGHAVT